MSSSSRTGRCRIRATTSASLRDCGAAGCSPRPASRRTRWSGSASTSPRARCCRRSPTGRRSAMLDDLRREPHAWVKLWKHHAAQPEADRINAVALERGEPWLPRYGGRISSEWFFAKALQILDEAPEVYARADRLIEACDWIVWQLTGVESRNACTAGYKAMWSKRDGFPASDYFAALDPRFAHVVDEKMSRTLAAARHPGGGAERARGRVDGSARGHAGRGRERRLPRLGAGDDRHRRRDARDDHGNEQRPSAARRASSCDVEGMCGVVEDGIVPGYFGYEAGQSALGDIFAWFTRARRAARVPRGRARARGRRPRRARRGGRGASSRRVRPARARLVERQSLGARRRRPARACSSG